MRRLQVITTNDGKFAEFSQALSAAVQELTRLDMPYPEVQADSLEEVVRFGMEWLSSRLEGSFVIDDSGLFIDSLGGFPGVYSSYAFRTLGMRGILKLLQGVPGRGATFKTVLGLYHNGTAALFQGECRGRISTSPEGDGGFGYDPVFIPVGEERSFAEMTPSEKNGVSHRGRAVAALVKHIRSIEGDD